MTSQDLGVIQSCKDEPSFIFSLMKQGAYEVAFDLLNNNIVNVNTVDGVGNDTITRMLKANQYTYVIELMKKRNWDVNHQNQEGNTFGHILAHDNSVMAVKVMDQLTKKKNYSPNIKNKRGETAMDIALSNHYLCTAFKLLEDKRFNDINVFSFKTLFDVSIKDKEYGRYTKLENLEIIVENLEKKELESSMQDLMDHITVNMEAIKRDILNNRSVVLESIIRNHMVME